MELAQNILRFYGINSLYTEKVTDNLFRVSDGQHEYALKRSSLTEDRLSNWEHVYKLANSLNLTVILPIYLTKEGKMYKKGNQTIFYLAPWINKSDGKMDKVFIENFFKMIGTIHSKTKQSGTISVERLKSNFNTYRMFCEDTKKKLLNYVTQFERNRYMSPFELQVCTHYRDIEYALNENMKRIDQLLNQDKETIPWNYCLCHGNLQSEHVLDRYLINWETAHYDNPIVDLVNFFNHETGDYDQPIDLFLELFSTYQKENELSLDELHLLTIYLLNPTNYLTIVEQYWNNKQSDQSMVIQIKLLQHTYRKLLFGLKWSDYVKQEFESISFEDLEG